MLLAAADEADPDHRACAALLETAVSRLRASPLVVAEAAYLIGRQLGPAGEARFFRAIAAGEISVEPLTGTDLFGCSSSTPTCLATTPRRSEGAGAGGADRDDGRGSGSSQSLQEAGVTLSSAPSLVTWTSNSGSGASRHE